jgi:cytochrome c553
MPPWQYTIAHPEARLTAAQKETLVQGFQASLGANAGNRGAAGLILASYAGADAEAIIRTRCVFCHSASLARDWQASNPAQAKALLDRMRRRGARIPVAEEHALVAHFTR